MILSVKASQVALEQKAEGEGIVSMSLEDLRDQGHLCQSELLLSLMQRLNLVDSVNRSGNSCRRVVLVKTYHNVFISLIVDSFLYLLLKGLKEDISSFSCSVLESIIVGRLGVLSNELIHALLSYCIT